MRIAFVNTAPGISAPKNVTARFLFTGYESAKGPITTAGAKDGQIRPVSARPPHQGARSAMAHFPSRHCAASISRGRRTSRDRALYVRLGLDLVTRHEASRICGPAADHHVVALRRADRPALRAIVSSQFRCGIPAIAAASLRHGATLLSVAQNQGPMAGPS